MRFSTKSRYGLRLMAELACSGTGRAMPLKEISERQRLSLKYLEQLVTPLARAGLVKSERGSQGGYHLVKDPSETHNAIADPQYAQRIAELRGHLIQELAGCEEGYSDGEKLIVGCTPRECLSNATLPNC